MARVAIAAGCAAFYVPLSTVGWRDMLKTPESGSPADAELPARLERHVRRLSEEIGDRNLYNGKLSDAAEYITGQFRDLGYRVEHQYYDAYGAVSANITASEPEGADGPVLIVGAHYDTWFNPGADDNASGVAGLLEVARIASRTDPRPDARFVAFTNEEPPAFQRETMGSLQYARSVKAAGLPVRGVIVFEMLGYYTDAPRSQTYPPLLGPFFPNRGNFIGVVGNWRSRRFLREVTEAFRRRSKFPLVPAAVPEGVPGAGWSDHWSFWRQGYPAVMVTDTAFFRNPNYHAQTDTADTLDYEKMARVVEGFAGVVAELSGAGCAGCTE